MIERWSWWSFYPNKKICTKLLISQSLIYLYIDIGLYLDDSWQSDSGVCIYSNLTSQAQSHRVVRGNQRNGILLWTSLMSMRAIIIGTYPESSCSVNSNSDVDVMDVFGASSMRRADSLIPH